MWYLEYDLSPNMKRKLQLRILIATENGGTSKDFIATTKNTQPRGESNEFECRDHWNRNHFMFIENLEWCRTGQQGRSRDPWEHSVR